MPVDSFALTNIGSTEVIGIILMEMPILVFLVGAFSPIGDIAGICHILTWRLMHGRSPSIQRYKLNSMKLFHFLKDQSLNQ